MVGALSAIPICVLSGGWRIEATGSSFTFVIMRGNCRVYESPESWDRGPSRVIRDMLGNALQDHRAGRLTEAERTYRQILTIDAHQADSLHLLGMIAYQAGRHEDAVTMIRQAIAINEQVAFFHSNLGIVLQAQGKLDEAAACYERALALTPDSAEVQTNLGNVLHVQHKLNEAVACHERALSLQPDWPKRTTTWGTFARPWTPGRSIS